MCNIQEPRSEAVVTAYKSLITCSQTHAFNTFNFLPVTLSLTAPPLFVTFQPDTPLLLLPPLVFRLFFPPLLMSFSAPCRRAAECQGENVAVRHLPYPQITVTFHARLVSPSWLRHAWVQGYVRNGTPSSSEAEISLHQSQTISPNRCPGGLQSGKS